MPPPVIYTTDGGSARVLQEKGWSPFRTSEWPNDYFAEDFLEWVAEVCPNCVGRWLCVPDIKKDLLPRYRLDVGRISLQFGALARGLAKVTKKREKPYTDSKGRRHTITEYFVPKYLTPDKPEAAVVELAEHKRSA